MIQIYKNLFGFLLIIFTFLSLDVSAQTITSGYTCANGRIVTNLSFCDNLSNTTQTTNQTEIQYVKPVAKTNVQKPVVVSENSGI